MPVRLLERLEEAVRRFGPGEGPRTAALIAALARTRFADAASLIRFHEALLFARAYPASREVVREADRVLFSFASRAAGMRGLDEPEVSGIAGTSFSAIFSYDVARRLAAAYPACVDVDWDGYEMDRLGRWWRRFLPLLEEDSLVEAGVPYLKWLQTAKGAPGPDLPWFLRRLEADQYDSLQLPLRWDLGGLEATRSRTRLDSGPMFFHDSPLIRRSEVSLTVIGDPLPLTRLSRKQSRAIIDIALDSSAPRYRELYGFTYGDPGLVLRAEAGRGVVFYFWGVPPARRLPLRAYHCALIVKNSVPVGYVETLSLFERMEVGFNIYYTFREGESAWLYSRLLRLFRQLMLVTCFSVAPYQVGEDNEEAVKAGAFWFYRKLGFRPVAPEAARLLAAEEKHLAAHSGYRTPPATLRRLGSSYMLFDGPGSQRGFWDRFEVRNLGLAVQRRMAARFGGDSEKMRREAVASVGRALGVRPGEWNGAARQAFENWALVLSLIPNLGRWQPEEKRQLVRVLRAKAWPDESRYIRTMTRHLRLRSEVMKLGSGPDR